MSVRVQRRLTVEEAAAASALTAAAQAAIDATARSLQTPRNQRSNVTTLATAERRANSALSRMKRIDRERGAPLVDQAVAEGRLSIDDRDSTLRAFEFNFEIAKQHIAELRPDPVVASRSYFSTGSNEADYRVAAAARLGIPASQVI